MLRKAAREPWPLAESRHPFTMSVKFGQPPRFMEEGLGSGGQVYKPNTNYTSRQKLHRREK